MLSQTSPAKFYRIAALAIERANTKNSSDIAQALLEAANEIQEDPAYEEHIKYGGLTGSGGVPVEQGGGSMGSKLPQNTNQRTGDVKEQL